MTPDGAIAAELPRQLAHGIAQPQPHALRTLVDRRPGVVERIHRQIREHVEIGLDVRAREDVLERRAEVLHVHVTVGHEQELGERELPFAEDPERAGHRLALVALLDDGRGERVIAGLAVRPEPLDRRHHQREQRRQQLLQEIADEEVLLARLADDGRRKDRIVAMRDALHLEHRVVVLQRVVAVVIAERPLGTPQLRRHLADQRELRVGDQRMRTAAMDLRQAVDPR